MNGNTFSITAGDHGDYEIPDCGEGRLLNYYSSGLRCGLYNGVGHWRVCASNGALVTGLGYSSDSSFASNFDFCPEGTARNDMLSMIFDIPFVCTKFMIVC